MATRPRPNPDAWDSDFEVQSSEDDSAEDDVQDSDSDEAMAPAAFRTPRRARRRARPPPAPRKKRRGLVDESSDSSDDDDGAPPPGYAYCAVCRRDVHADSFSAAVLRGDYGYNMAEPYCLAHSPQDLRDYRASGEGGASRLQTTTLDSGRRAFARADRDDPLVAADALDAAAVAAGSDSDDSSDSSDDDAPPPPRLRRHADAASPRRRLDFDDVSDDEEEARAPEAECAICLAPIRDEEAFSTACAHQFHTACVAQQAAHDRAARRERGGVAQAQRCPLCRTPFPEVVAAAARGAATELATRETADLRPGMNVEVQWELDGAPTWYRAKLVRHLGPHSRHTTINPNELPDRFLAARGFMMKYDGESEERGAWLASDGLLLDATEGISMHWRPARRRRRRVA
ncbi:unnamed protein product [Pelagomonas calceolata]|uniref:RING-type domain-containing protein n=2 Tax=Pelagomonas calceolata TaxID=35677 RepID=A0A8J2WSQ4_9STRA|nr:unnamed protein product [Pelagomonas calceolata]